MHYLSIRLNFLYFFLEICEMGVKERVGVFCMPVKEKSGNSQGILITVLGMNPVCCDLAFHSMLLKSFL